MEFKKYTQFRNKRMLFLSLMFWAFSAFTFQGMAQSRTITGKITDAGSSESLIGANILLKGTKRKGM